MKENNNHKSQLMHTLVYITMSMSDFKSYCNANCAKKNLLHDFKNNYYFFYSKNTQFCKIPLFKL